MRLLSQYLGKPDAIRQGRSYVSDGKSYIMDFTVNDLEVGTKNSLIKLKGDQPLKVSARIVTFLPEAKDSIGALVATRRLTKKPYWDIERARKNKSRNIPVELIVNGISVDTVLINADGKIRNVSFSYQVARSSWVALRVLASSHSNPIFVEIDGKPVLEKKSAEWSLAAVDQCWKMKKDNIRPLERQAAAEAYEKARNVYKLMLSRATFNVIIN